MTYDDIYEKACIKWKPGYTMPDFILQLTYSEKVVVYTYHLLWAVSRQGFNLWFENNYHIGYEELLYILQDINTDASKKIHEIVLSAVRRFEDGYNFCGCHIEKKDACTCSFPKYSDLDITIRGLMRELKKDIDNFLLAGENQNES